MNNPLYLSFNDWFAQARLLLDFLIIAWAFTVINGGFFNWQLNRLGVYPRDVWSLFRIPLAPFLHADWNHLIGNTKYYLLLGGILVLRDPSDFSMVTFVSLWVSGLLGWFFGRAKTSYIGASDINAGYFGFLLTQILVNKDAFAAVFFSLIIFSFFFGDMIVFPRLTGEKTPWNFGNTLVWGMTPVVSKNVAWESHLFGFFGGVIAAYYRLPLKDLIQQLAILWKNFTVG
ncbi:rhomboid family intramembrane serine protease [Alkalinema sp. FACHB-956]|uniref:rhomboid family intramembrane serine protease n=1 Tax=Alkalinema sp. FACHB-956 TaxID=2692768 RepID=UPI0016897F48|nr:rhomboid family intramembrane serine protease [Alkalinema sp. FACHB-956]MBD2325614.1 rhomboid family intramembrane serine protease [Alkalinema sp. FACHB-956]